ncbi:acyltransferase family protein [Enterobacter soli]|uniref:acyltransferase family protein n=1 Tax=Enterobacter soli TaxID=885040 RepID=UPI0034D016F1
MQKKIDFIDALRGIAAFYVVLYHIGHVTWPAFNPPSFILPIINNGGSGVILFFVLSAFTLCMSMDSRSATETKHVRNYFIRRFFRIAPLFYFILAVSIIRNIYIFNVVNTPQDIMNNILFIFNFIPGKQSSIAWAGWTIGVEMAFYVVFPIIYKYSKTLLSSVLVLGVALIFREIIKQVLLSQMGDNQATLLFYNTTVVRHAPAFIIGMITYNVYKDAMTSGWLSRSKGMAMVLISIISFLVVCYNNNFVEKNYDANLIKATIFSILIIGLLAFRPKAIVNNFSIFSGKISYSMYLVHPTVVYLLSPVTWWIKNSVGNEYISYLLLCVTTFGVVYGIATITYKTIEAFGNRTGKRLINYLEGRSSGRAIA